MKPIQELSKQEKLTKILEYNPCRVERNTILRYLLAVRREHTDEIAYFESFGNSVHKLILNIRTYEQGLKFGFTRKQFNEYGWLECKMEIVERIELGISNHIIIGKAPNNKYVVTVNWSTGGAGGGSFPSIWDKPIDTFKDAVKTGINKLQEHYDYALRHSSDSCNYNATKTRALIKLLKDVKLKYLYPPQRTLFDLDF